jgi:hypothetical protein
MRSNQDKREKTGQTVGEIRNPEDNGTIHYELQKTPINPAPLVRRLVNHTPSTFVTMRE